MALFGKLFEKKNCSICGEEIGLLGNRKLSDGNCCKTCAGKLSPWFRDRKDSTVEQIKGQLEYRARNAEELRSFDVAQIIGEYQKMYVEKKNGIPSRFFITDESDYLDGNPDIISFADVMSCSVDIDEREEELMRENKDGEEVSYNPPRFQYHYDFYIDMVIRNNPYFDAIRFNVNDEDVTLEKVRAARPSMEERRGGMVLPAMRNPAINRDEDRYREYEQMCRMIVQTVEDAKNGAQAQVEAEEAAEAAIPAVCPACGAPTDGSRFCQFCGTRLG